MQKTPRGMRLHIGIFGKRNVGKSYVLNSFTNQNISIVSEIAGTTTDPVEKAMELLPFGPVLFVDTAGIDDEGILGEMRIHKTKKIFDRTDLAVIVTDHSGWGKFEEELYKEFTKRKISIIAVFNKADLGQFDPDKIQKVKELGLEPVIVSAKRGDGINDLKQKIIKLAPEEFLNTSCIIADLVPQGELVILVVPIDLEAPKGRIILPQVHTIRDLLDNNSMMMVVKESELESSLNRLNKPPYLVVTDSQAFEKVSEIVPKDVKITSFSILFARFKGDLNEFVKGTEAIKTLKPHDKILICESCTHHPIGDDIGRVKIPVWLSQYIGGELEFEYYTGHDFPENLSDYKLIIHCGACMTNRREVLSRIMKACQANVPITNYGLAIAYSLGIFERALAPFSLQVKQEITFSCNDA
ncbi:MAG: [FeFe] hydrogenase H-cluster maturation GTPase HydF [bacterium]